MVGLSNLSPSVHSPKAAGVGRCICLAIFALGGVILLRNLGYRSHRAEELHRVMADRLHRVMPRAETSCPNSLRDTRGLICVRNQLWSSILREDEASWHRIRKNINRFRRLQDVRQAVWVPTFSCPFEQRIGELADGGKWVCNSAYVGASKRWNSKQDGCLVYSFGCGGKFGFEVQLLNKTNGHCEVDLFDHGARMWRAPRLNGLHIYEYGLTKKTSESAKFKSYGTLLKQLKHEQRTVNLLKMDIEGGERLVLPEIAALPHRQRPQQILMELHWKDKHIGLMNDILLQLREAGYVLFHMEPNFYCGSCTEFSFLHLSSRTMT